MSSTTLLQSFRDDLKVTAFSSPQNEIYATYTPQRDPPAGPVAVKVRGEDFRGLVEWWLRRKKGARRAPKLVESIVSELEGDAKYGPGAHRRDVVIRATAHDGAISIDLADDRNRVVRVSPGGWVVTTDSPVAFIRPRGAEPLPEPRSGPGGIDALFALLPKLDQPAKSLILGWILAALNPRVQFPVLILNGAAGSGKSTTAAFLRGLVDPSVAGLTKLARLDESALWTTAANGYALCFDNVSAISADVSDTLCMIATGGSHSARKLYTDTDTVLVRKKCPILLSGISEFANREDLLSRALLVRCPVIGGSAYTKATALQAAFDAARPTIFAAVLDLLAAGLRSDLTLPAAPRMADAAEWVERCFAGGGYHPGSFVAAVEAQQAARSGISLDAWPPAEFVTTVAADGFEGTTAELLTRITRLARDSGLPSNPAWPKSPSALGVQLREREQSLLVRGIVREDFPGRREGRRIRLYCRPAEAASKAETGPATWVEYRAIVAAGGPRIRLLAGPDDVPRAVGEDAAILATRLGRPTSAGGSFALEADDVGELGGEIDLLDFVDTDSDAAPSRASTSSPSPTEATC
ncbi:hypothetical protein [Limnoglobus roseus]|uniref:ATP-binding protein n=1 Tax=Limnoglobus roseus TaxID=2598579 RepID=A0A5C1AUZ8_9BACT|nr:hypothetical protein [Limnoglobus roseus]QEL21094.1 hypothetical protein PX52LOC_08223 [Limnoglobus roseus]